MIAPLALPYFGSFQKGQHFRTGDPLNAVWRSVERLGTIDNLTRIATLRSLDTATARTASLRIRQAVELRKVSLGTTPLSRPLLLYYSALNLVRGALMTQLGHMGAPGHGLRYVAGTSALTCSALSKKSGTFVQFTEMLGLKLDGYEGKALTLRNVFSVIPELANDFSLLNVGVRSIAYVVVNAIYQGPMKFRYHIDGITEDDFAAQWPDKLPWLKDVCDCVEPFTLQFRANPKDETEVEELCKKHLLHDLNWREDAVWYDHIVGNDVVLLPRISAYLAALFILSNMCRYEPELIDGATRDPTDLAYVLNTFLDHVERYFPQLILEALYGTGMFFR